MRFFSEHKTPLLHNNFSWRSIIQFSCGFCVLIVLCLSLDGLFHVFSRVGRDQHNPCTMTYMWPNYYPIPMVNRSEFAYKYRVFQFSHHAVSKKAKEFRSNAIIVFFHGNSGSFRQICSLGKELTVKVEEEYKGLGIGAVDFYTFDFRQEYSALSGVFLDQQSRFAFDAVKHIYDLHRRNATGPIKMIFVGHSMGGIVARLVLSRLDGSKEHLSNNALQKSIISLVSFSTPHRAPLLGFDAIMYRIYATLREHKDESRHYLSLSGGYRDIVVNGKLSQLDHAQYNNSVTLLTTLVNSISTDHQAILWCNQVVKSVANELTEFLEIPTLAQRKIKRTPRTRFYKSFPKISIGPPGYVRNTAEHSVPRFSLFRMSIPITVINAMRSYVSDVIVRNYSCYIFQHCFLAGVLSLSLAIRSWKREVMGFVGMLYLAWST